MKSWILALASLVSFSAFAQEDDLELIGGRRVRNGENPASFPVIINGAGGCTGTLVGDRVLAFAGHCADTGDTIEFQLGAGKATGSCTRNPKFDDVNAFNDVSLCLIDGVVQNVVFERINLNNALVRIGSVLQIVGAGCQQPGGNDGSFGVLKTGKVTVSRLPAGANTDFTVSGNGVAACFGDSGGPSFTNFVGGGRVVSSLTSKGDIRRLSFLSSTSVKGNADFFKQFAAANRVSICGVAGDQSKCHK